MRQPTGLRDKVRTHLEGPYGLHAGLLEGGVFYEAYAVADQRQAAVAFLARAGYHLRQ
jgi:hypothetical protein